MPPGSGIAAQAGFGVESVVGTGVTVDHFPEFNSETVNYVKGILQGQGLHAGGYYDRASRRVVSTKGAGGDITMDHATKKMNIFWKYMLGSTPVFTQQGATTAWKAVHQPGTSDGMSFTYQKGVPQTDGTVRPFTFNGGKISSWTFSVTDQQIAQLALTMDFWNVATATGLAAASYPAGNEVFNFSQVTAFTLGGTASTTSGVVSIASGVAATTLFKGYSLTGTKSLAADRRGLGNAGIKKEQIENGYRELSGTLDGEFTSRTEIWDLMQADTTTALQITFTGSNIASTFFNTIDIILPVVKFDTADVSVGGPDIVMQSVPFKVLDDGVNAPIQVSITSTDTVV
jgi:hypothetical protein